MNKERSNGRTPDQADYSRIPAVEFDPAVYAKLLTYVSECETELSGLGTVDFVDGALVVRDVYLLPQKSSSATTEIEEVDVAEFLREFVRAGGDARRLRLHWHSHGANAAYWSPTDEGQQITGFRQAEWSLFLVVNHAGDMRACLQVRGPVAGRYDHLPIRLHVPAEVRANLVAEIAEKVQKIDYASWYRTRQGYWALGSEGCADAAKCPPTTSVPAATRIVGDADDGLDAYEDPDSGDAE